MENGRVKFEGSSEAFLKSGGYKAAEEDEEPVEVKDKAKEKSAPVKPRNKHLANIVAESAATSETSSASETEDGTDSEDEIETKKEQEKKVARKLIDDEAKAVGAVAWDVWALYLGLSGGVLFWIVFVFSFGGAKLSDVAQGYWLNIWAASCESGIFRRGLRGTVLTCRFSRRRLEAR